MMSQDRTCVQYRRIENTLIINGIPTSRVRTSSGCSADLVTWNPIPYEKVDLIMTNEQTCSTGKKHLKSLNS